jgi:hypothetical protein
MTGQSRAALHTQVGEALQAAASSEWAAVCYFYAAYHLAIEAIRRDPVFDDPTRLSKLNPALTPEDRFTKRHHPRKNGAHGREWGVNELVLLLYDQKVAAAYDKLHYASVEVRYGTGLSSPLDRVREWLNTVEVAALNGDLICQRG